MRTALATALVAGVLGGPSTAATAPEYQLKAAFLCNLAKYVEWPPERAAEARIVVGVWGKDPFGTALDEAAKSTTVRGRRLEARLVKNMEEARRCHIVFLGAPGSTRDVEALGQAGVLTVGDGEVEGLGALVRFGVEEGRVRLYIDLNAVQRSRLRIGSQLLRLARLVPAPAR